MFCPKCGKQLPDDAVFCGGCGKRLNNNAPRPAGAGPQAAPQASKPTPAAAVSAQVPSNSAGSADRFATAAVPSPSLTQAPAQAAAVSFTPVGIVARVCALAALFCMFLPWVNMPMLESVNSFGAFMGLGNSTVASSYTMFSIRDLAEGMKSLASTFGASSSVDGLVTLCTAFFVAWVVAVLALLAGLVVSFLGKKNSLLVIPGGAIAAFLAMAWAGVVSSANAEIANQLSSIITVDAAFLEVPPAVFLTILFGVATIVLGVIGKARS